MDMLFEILFAWNLIGCLVYVGIQLEATHDFIPYVLLNPCDIYDIWEVNYFGCGDDKPKQPDEEVIYEMKSTGVGMSPFPFGTYEVRR